MQEMLAVRLHADERAQEFVIGGDEGRGQEAVRDQLVPAVYIGDDGLQQLGALDEAAR